MKNLDLVLEQIEKFWLEIVADINYIVSLA
jgi:hypothetical protein